MKRKHPAAVALGSLGGRVRSDAKAAASRENGKKGGRPKKPAYIERLEQMQREIETVARANGTKPK